MAYQNFYLCWLRAINSCWLSLILLSQCGCSEWLCLGDGFACFLRLAGYAASPTSAVGAPCRNGSYTSPLIHSRCNSTPISALPLLPPAFSHSSRLSRTPVAHTVVSLCPVRTAPGYNAHSLPVAAAALRLPFYGFPNAAGCPRNPPAWAPMGIPAKLNASSGGMPNGIPG